MREIKFKGVKKSDGKWIIGDLNHIEGKVFIFNRTDEGLNSPDDYEVDPNTVGQFTGLKDKNGVEIYEGNLDKEGYMCKYSKVECCYIFVTEKDMGGFYKLNYRCSDAVEIIGNIHDKKKS